MLVKVENEDEVRMSKQIGQSVWTDREERRRVNAQREKKCLFKDTDTFPM